MSAVTTVSGGGGVRLLVKTRSSVTVQDIPNAMLRYLNKKTFRFAKHGSEIETKVTFENNNTRGLYVSDTDAHAYTLCIYNGACLEDLTNAKVQILKDAFEMGYMDWRLAGSPGLIAGIVTETV